jgi:hypothetical protein
MSTHFNWEIVAFGPRKTRQNPNGRRVIIATSVGSFSTWAECCNDATFSMNDLDNYGCAMDEKEVIKIEITRIYIEDPRD